ncbi:hypothetical protein [Chitinophaga arvensicola]|uniref:Uncharacterized protein n=1 Tax=Chitinophaga arvensicola TaxID=29529 RepID=A0A1I0QXS4_9BACT|nr:hypothetical protein [Chitinophaga arvensicola]SEW32376.1 hypothetical protein SAMN04488122_1857 [Chitinophaga arvensicola]
MIHRLDIRVIATDEKSTKFDFFVDEEQLDSRFGINRLTNIAFTDFDLDLFEVDAVRFPGYNRLEIVKRAINIFLGKEPASNQLETGRVVLYRCHCGSDYCGVISFQLKIEEDYIYWIDIRHEIDGTWGPDDLDITVIPELKFERPAYERLLNAFAEKYCF